MLGAKHPQTTSLGRLFDACAALLGFPQRQDFEGQAAMRLEALVRQPKALPGGHAWREGKLDFTPLLAHLIDARPDAREGAELAARNADRRPRRKLFAR